MLAPHLLLVLLLALLSSALPYDDDSSDPSTCPTNPDQPPAAYTLRVRRVHGMPRHLAGAKIQASSQGFYIGLAVPTTFCPLLECPPGNETVFEGLVAMDVIVPGGQIVYVTPDHELGFTQAHSASMPPGSVTDGFSYCRRTRTLAFNGQGFLACPEVPDFVVGATHRVFVEDGGKWADGCVRLGGLRARAWNGPDPVWEYT